MRGGNKARWGLTYQPSPSTKAAASRVWDADRPVFVCPENAVAHNRPSTCSDPGRMHDETVEEEIEKMVASSFPHPPGPPSMSLSLEVEDICVCGGEFGCREILCLLHDEAKKEELDEMTASLFPSPPSLSLEEEVFYIFYLLIYFFGEFGCK